METYNPWRGLASYKDPLTAKHKYKFCGRDAEISSLVKLIDNNLFVTLYGRTGVGKTSILNAGVFPILRQRDYFPIYIRLAQESKKKSYAKSIVDKIQESGLKVIRDGNQPFNNDGRSKTYLWNYFCTTKFKAIYDGQEHEVYPVIVLDQFEEIFFLKKDDTNLLLQQIYVLLSDDLALPEGYSDNTNYRFIASIREDNLFYLEDSIDELSLDLYKDNRYRLKPLNAENAKAAILEPGIDCINTEKSREIAEKIIEMSKDKDGTISSLILSLICSLMYEQAAKANPQKPTINLWQIPTTDADTNIILSDFYRKNTTKKQRKIIEENLLTDDGHRKAADVAIPDSKKLTSGGSRILQTVETDTGKKVEIVHDRMATVIYLQRQRRDANRYRNVMRVVVALFLLVALCTAIAISWTSSTIPRPLAIYTERKFKSNIDTTITENSSIRFYKRHSNTPGQIKKIYIGKDVSHISYIFIPDNVEFVISPENKHLKWDYIYTSDGLIGYLHYTETPDTAEYMQRKPDNNKKIRLPKNIQEIYYKGTTYKHTEGMPYYGIKEAIIKARKDFEAYKYDDKIESVKLIGVNDIPLNAFWGCINLKSINLDNVKHIRIGAFLNCRSLETIRLENNCTVGDAAFAGCFNLKEVYLPKEISITGSDVFAHCYNLKTIHLPDDIYTYSNKKNIASLFKCCFNIQEVTYSDNSHFKLNPKDSIIYYDSIPVIFNFCHIKDWCMPDSSYYIYHGAVLETKYTSTNNFALKSLSKSNAENEIVGVLQNGNFYPEIYPLTKTDSILDLPVGYSSYTYFSSNRSITEIHTPIGDPYSFSFNASGIENLDKSKITLYVPHGCKKIYEQSGRYDDYKNIMEDSLSKRIRDTMLYYWQGIESFFGAHALLLYPLIVTGLAILFYTFYWLRKNQIKNRCTIDYKLKILGINIVYAMSTIRIYYVIYSLYYPLILGLAVLLCIIFYYMLRRKKLKNQGWNGFYVICFFVFYPLIALGLLVYFCRFNMLHIKQMKKLGITDYRWEAAKGGIIGMVVAVIGFVPIYYVIFIALQNHFPVEEVYSNSTLCTIIGSIGGVISSCITSYFFVFSGKGKIWRSRRRMAQQ